jgi:rubrerythrin
MLEVALNNAVEGCVYETWAACLATHQAVTAPDAVLRRIFAKIARDEVRHAQLAWDLHEWFLTQLSPEEAQQVQAAQHQAMAALAAEVPAGNHPELGFPTDKTAQDLKALFVQSLAA